MSQDSASKGRLSSLAGRVPSVISDTAEPLATRVLAPMSQTTSTLGELLLLDLFNIFTHNWRELRRPAATRFRKLACYRGTYTFVEVALAMADCRYRLLLG